MNIVSTLLDRNKNNGSQAAIYFYEKFQLKNVLTYEGLFSEVHKRAETLKKNQAQGFALLCIVHPLEFVINFLALVEADCIPVPLPPVNVSLEEHFLHRLTNLFSNYQFDFVIVDEVSERYFMRYKMPILNTHLECLHFGPLHRISSKAHAEACFVQFSSGSTSEPKGIVINHQQLIENLAQIHTALDPTVTDKLVTWLPLYHDMGLIGAILSPLYAKAEVHLMATRDFLGHAENYIDLICNKKINFVLGPDFMYRQFTRVLMSKNFDLSHLKVCMSGAELVLPSTTKEFIKALEKSNCTKAVFRPVYGMAEACLGVTFTRASDAPLILQFSAEREVVSCGYPLEGQFVEIIDASHHRLADREVGEIAIKGKSIFTEYFMNKNQKLTTADGFYLTGDEGFLYKQQLYLLGRKKDVIIHSGIKHHSVDLENHIYENLKSDIGRIACVQSSRVYVVAEISWLNLYKKRKIRKKILYQLTQKIPAEIDQIFIVPKFDLPRTTSGKIQRYKIIKNIEQRKYESQFYFLRSIYKMLKEIRGLTR